jgi:hypothetical protein
MDRACTKKGGEEDCLYVNVSTGKKEPARKTKILIGG